jgi:geranylgeranylglycerol-phosphate geranylgeranyltransferase
MRILNCMLAAAGVLVGAYLTGYCGATASVIYSALAAFFVCGAGNVHNDIVDIPIDRISHGGRPLAAGRLSVPGAYAISVVAALVGLVFAFLSNSFMLLASVAALGFLYLYNVRSKRVPLLGNCVIAFLGALTFAAGGLAVNVRSVVALPGPLIASAFAFPMHLTREIVKDVQDIKGDAALGVRTLPQAIGVNASLRLGLVLIILLVLLTIVPILTGWYGIGYALLALLGVDLPLLIVLLAALYRPTEQRLKAASTGLKLAMAVGLVALFLG